MLACNMWFLKLINGSVARRIKICYSLPLANFSRAVLYYQFMIMLIWCGVKRTMWLLWMTCRFCGTRSRKLTWTGYFIGLYSLATDALVTLKWLNLGSTVDFIMVVYMFTSVLMALGITLWSHQQTGTFIITRGDSHIKLTEMLVLSLWGVNCRFWSHLRCLGWKVTIYLPHSSIA